LERHLEHRPVEARPPSLIYLASRFVRRHRWWVVGATAVLVALLAGGSAAGWGWWTANREARIARAEKQKADEVLGLLFRTFVQVVPAEGGRPEYTEKQMLADLGEIADSGQVTSPEVEAAVRDLLSYFYREFGEFEMARDHALKGLALIQDIAVDPRLAAGLHVRLGQILKDIGPQTEALWHLEKALAIYRGPAGLEHTDSLRVMLLMARVRQRMGDGEAGVALAREALELARAQIGTPDGEAQLIRCLHMLAFIHQHEGRFAEQEPLVLERLELARRRNGDSHPETLHALSDLGVLRFHQRRFDEAEPLLAEALAGRRRHLGNGYPDTLETLVALARCRGALGDAAGATKLFDEMLRLSADTLGPRNPYWREWGRQALAHFEASGNRVRAAELNALLESLDPAVKE
jgi:serine/threonine-protein kinase